MGGGGIRNHVTHKAHTPARQAFAISGFKQTTAVFGDVQANFLERLGLSNDSQITTAYGEEDELNGEVSSDD